MPAFSFFFARKALLAFLRYVCKINTKENLKRCFKSIPCNKSLKLNVSLYIFQIINKRNKISFNSLFSLKNIEKSNLGKGGHLNIVCTSFLFSVNKGFCCCLNTWIKTKDIHEDMSLVGKQ